MENKIYYTATIVLRNNGTNANAHQKETDFSNQINDDDQNLNNWWALSALALVLGTAAGNILVCLAITWERRLQNVTNYFLMSLAITDLMVAILVMPLGILTLVRGKLHISFYTYQNYFFLQNENKYFAQNYGCSLA